MENTVTWLYLLPGLGAFLAGLGTLLWWARRARDKVPIWLGMGSWVAGVALKAAWALPLNEHVRRGLTGALGSAGEPVFWVYVGFLTGFFEVGMAWLVARTTRLRRASFDDAISFGIGFGTVEALLVGFAGTVPVVIELALPHRLPPEARAVLFKHPMSWMMAVDPAVERLATIVFHVSTSALAVLSVRTRRLRWLWLSVALKTALDGMAAWAILSFGVKESVVRMTYVEAGLVALAAVSYPLFGVIRRGFAAAPVPPPESHNPAGVGAAPAV